MGDSDFMKKCPACFKNEDNDSVRFCKHCGTELFYPERFGEANKSINDTSNKRIRKRHNIIKGRQNKSMKIRIEKPSDYPEVECLVKTSFATNADDDGTTHEYLNKLRKKSVFIPDLSLVAEKNGTIIGQVVLYKTDITTPNGKQTELLLSPICVHPNYFRQGVARAMNEEALRKAKNMGYKAVFLCGNPNIYSNMGFVPSYKYNIRHITDPTAQWSMARELYEGALAGLSGTIDTI